MSLKRLYKALSTREIPSVLFLGQQIKKATSGTDPLLSLAAQYSEKEVSDYHSLVSDKVFDDSFFKWLQHELEEAPYLWLNSYTKIHWNAVFTSIVDDCVERAFTHSERNILPIYSYYSAGRSKKSRDLLSINKLFGRLVYSDDGQFPRSKKDMRVRQAEAVVPMLNDLVNIVGSLGVLIIDGYSPDLDLLTDDVFISILDRLGIGQVFWFGLSAGLQVNLDSEIGEYIETGVITPFEEDLTSFLNGRTSSGELTLPSILPSHRNELPVRIGENQVLSIPDDIWFNVSVFSVPVTSQCYGDVGHLSDDKLYSLFKDFHGGMLSEERFLQGVDCGFSVERNFERNLSEIVTSALSSQKQRAKPILVHGQSGVGKSISLARLSLEIAKKGKWPVLFFKTYHPSTYQKHIDQFCDFVESQGVSATLLVVDARADSSVYETLTKSLASRGRNVVVVGSCYRLQEEQEGLNTIHAPAVLEDTEYNLIADLLSLYIDNVQALKNIFQEEREHFLPLIYRYLPQTRTSLRMGIATEVAASEEDIRRRAEQHISTPTKTILGELLEKKGWKVRDQLIKKNEGYEHQDDLVSQIINSVMVPGKLGLAVPFDLLMREVGRADTSAMIHLFMGIDIFRWKEDEQGNFHVMPRLPLEAELVCAEKLDATREAECAIKLLSKIKRYGDGEEVELNFASSLARALGANGPQKKRYLNSYLQIAESLERLREHDRIFSSYLILQEVNLRREAVICFDEIISSESPNDLLLKNIAILKEAYRDISVNKTSSVYRHKSKLINELATNYGTLAYQTIENLGDISLAIEYHREGRQWALKANSIDPDNRHTVHTLIWPARDILKKSPVEALNEQWKSELQVDLIDAVERSEDLQTEADDYKRFQFAKLSVGNVLNDVEISSSAFENLISIGSASGIVLRAYSILNERSTFEVIKENDWESIDKAIASFEEYMDITTNDPRALRMYFYLQWGRKLRKCVFDEERSPLPGAKSDLALFYDLVVKILQAEEESSPRFIYLKAVLAWAKKDFIEAENTWKELARITDYSYSRRVIKQHVLADENGIPLTFSGTVQSYDEHKGRGAVYVLELNHKVKFFMADMRIAECHKEMHLTDFQIAFNFIGPVAMKPRPIKRK